MPCDLSAIAPFVTFPTLMVSIIHLILRFTLLGLLHAGCWATFSCTEQCEQGLQLRTHRRRGENSSVGSWEEQCWGPQPNDLCAASPVQQWWGWRERWQFFLHAFPLFIIPLFICFFSAMGSTQTLSWMLLFVAWLQLSMVIREVVAHWPLPSSARVIG